MKSECLLAAISCCYIQLFVWIC